MPQLRQAGIVCPALPLRLLLASVAAALVGAAAAAGAAEGAKLEDTIDELGDVLATVDGKPIRKSDVYPRAHPIQISLEKTVKPAVARYIDNMLTAQAAVVAGVEPQTAAAERQERAQSGLAARESALVDRRHRW